jgi:hypothetical protein
VSISAAGKISNPVRLSGNVSEAFVTLTFGGNYAAGGEDLIAALKAGIAGFNTTADPIFLVGTTDTGYTCRLESSGKLTLWNGATEMAAAPYAATTADVMVIFEKY